MWRLKDSEENLGKILLGLDEHLPLLFTLEVPEVRLSGVSNSPKSLEIRKYQHKTNKLQK